MTSPLLALRGAILARVGGDAALAALMGGVVRLYDEPPRGSVPVYAVFGEAEIRDDSVCRETELLAHGQRNLPPFSKMLAYEPTITVLSRRDGLGRVVIERRSRMISQADVDDRMPWRRSDARRGTVQICNRRF